MLGTAKAHQVPNVFVVIGKGAEVAAKDLVKFVDDIGLEAKAVVSPRALIALALLAAAAEPVMLDVIAASAAEGLNIPLDIETATLLAQLWPEFKAYLATLTIQPSKQPVAQGAKP
jgi:hypothetical protein